MLMVLILEIRSNLECLWKSRLTKTEITVIILIFNFFYYKLKITNYRYISVLLTYHRREHHRY